MYSVFSESSQSKIHPLKKRPSFRQRILSKKPERSIRRTVTRRSSVGKDRHKSSIGVIDWGDDDHRSVFIRDETYVWLPAELHGVEGTLATVSIKLPEGWEETTSGSTNARNEIRTVKLSDCPGRELPLQNVDDDNCIVGKNDLADLPFLHEAAMLYNLKEQNAKKEPYMRVGDIIVATNPFEWIDGLYSRERQEVYADKLIWRDPRSRDDQSISQIHSLDRKYEKLGGEPHVYETSCLAYKGLAMDGQNQAILVTGGSGAGKTETVKIIMSHLAHIHSAHPDITPSVSSLFEKKAWITQTVLESNPVFEAFGNAKTVLNDNSSRFGRFTQLQFDVEDESVATEAGRQVPLCILAGCNCETFLLEKARVVGHDFGERSYHIFYQLLAASDEFKHQVWNGLSGSDPSDFQYLGGEVANVIDGVSPDKVSWKHTTHALSLFGISGDDLITLMRALCVVLQLGNLTFESDLVSEETVISSREELEKLSDVMGVATDDLTTALTKRKLKTSKEINLSLSPEAAKEGCDALAKEMYARVFDCLVRSINKTTTTGKLTMVHNDVGTSKKKKKKHKGKQVGFIGLLDMYGFEFFDKNRFEQFCINYANETLQHKYIMDICHKVRLEYVTEGIEVFDFSTVDNAELLKFIEGKSGVIQILNEECIRPKGNDASFVYKIKSMKKHRKRLIKDRFQGQCEFSVKHFAGPVEYDATRFVEHNQDTLPEELIVCACQSTNEVISREFQDLYAALAFARKHRTVEKTAISKFKSQLDGLMKSLEHTKNRYVRCIMPNLDGTPGVMDHKLTLSQLKSAGLTTAITISRETYPNHLPYEVVLERFCCLATCHDFLNAKDAKTKTRLLLALLLRGKDKVVEGEVIPPFACGKTKVFFRSGSLELLETYRMNLYEDATLMIQRWYRCVSKQKKYEAYRKTNITLQAIWRSKMERKSYSRHITSMILMQRCVRRFIASYKYRLARSLVITMQAHWRRKVAKKSFHEQVTALIILQRWSASFITQQKYELLRNETVALQTHWRGKVARTSFYKQVTALIELQNWIRSIRAQQTYQTLRKSIIALQARWRRKVESKSYREKVAALIVLQKWCRCLISRYYYQLMNNAIVSLQAHWRGKVARKSFQEQVTASIVLQSWARSFTCRQKYVMMKASAIMLQAHRRSYLARKSFRDHLTALIVLQSWVRLVTARNKYQSIRNSIILLQAHCRRKVSRESYHAQVAALIVLQRWVRCFTCRQKYKSMKSSATSLPRLWKGRFARDSYYDYAATLVVILCWTRQINTKRKLKRLKEEYTAATVAHCSVRVQKAEQSPLFSQYAKSPVKGKNGADKNQLGHKIKEYKNEFTDLEDSGVNKQPSSSSKEKVQKLQKVLANVDTRGMSKKQETVFDENKKTLGHLDSDVHNLLDRVNNLEEELAREKQMLDQYKSQTESSVAALAKRKKDIKQLKKTNQALAENVKMCQTKNDAFKKVIKVLHDENKHKAQDEVLVSIKSYSAEVAQLKKQMEKVNLIHDSEVGRLKRVLAEQKETHREELKMAHDDHIGDITTIYSSFQQYVQGSITDSYLKNQ